MPVMKFKSFGESDRFEREGKGINYKFIPDENYIRKALRFQIKIPFPRGIYKFKTFEEAQKWETEWWIKSGATKRNS